MDDAQSQDSNSTMDDFYVITASPPRMQFPNNSDPAQVQSEINDILCEANLKTDALKPESVHSPSPSNDVTLLDTNDKVNKNMYLDHVIYLGSASISRPKDATELQALLKELRTSPNSGLSRAVTISVPSSCYGELRLFSNSTGSEKQLLRSFPLVSMALIIRDSNSSDLGCLFAFSFCESLRKSLTSTSYPVQLNQPDIGASISSDMPSLSPSMNSTSSISLPVVSSLFKCHVFQCKTATECESVVRQLRQACYSQFSGMPSRNQPPMDALLRLDIDIREDDGNGNFHAVPREKPNLFKLRSQLEKRIILTVTQISGQVNLTLLRCVGLFIGVGSSQNQNGSVLLETECVDKHHDRRTITVTGMWTPTEKEFHLLNTPSEKDTHVFFTVGLHLHAPPVDAPITLQTQLRARIYSESERFWLFNKKPFRHEFRLCLKESVQANELPGHRKVTMYELSLILPSNALPSTPSIELFEKTDDDEPLLSGSGHVSKEVNDELMKQWESVLNTWHVNLDETPSTVKTLVQQGIPEALRGEVWMRLVKVHQKEKYLLEAYKVLISKDSQFDAPILRDMNRTFPGNELFSDFERQQQLFRVSKAYSLYDEEIGYVQGTSFLIAALLLHMPEEQAWMVFVQIMNVYHLRDIMLHDFQGLHLCLHKLECLLMENFHDLWQHFHNLSVSPIMYASQWFITLFSSKFPLHASFHILDLFLYEGMDAIYKVALSLLKSARTDLLKLDFDGILKFFRVSLPKRYQDEESVDTLITNAVQMKIKHSKMQKYEQEWLEKKRLDAQMEDPVGNLERELQSSKTTCRRLDQENDLLASKLIYSKTAMQADIELFDKWQWHDKYDTVSLELFNTRSELTETKEQATVLRKELEKVKIMLRRELSEKESALQMKDNIIQDYKEITRNLSLRLEQQEKFCRDLQTHMRQCDTSCNPWLDTYLQVKKERTRSHSVTDGDTSPAIYNTGDGESFNIQTTVLVTGEEAMASRVQELEMLLARTKLELTQCECTLQHKIHEVKQLQAQIQQFPLESPTQSKSSASGSGHRANWWNKGLQSLREMTTTFPSQTSQIPLPAGSRHSFDATPVLQGRPTATSLYS